MQGVHTPLQPGCYRVESICAYWSQHLLGSGVPRCTASMPHCLVVHRVRGEGGKCASSGSFCPAGHTHHSILHLHKDLCCMHPQLRLKSPPHIRVPVLQCVPQRHLPVPVTHVPCPVQNKKPHCGKPLGKTGPQFGALGATCTVRNKKR